MAARSKARRSRGGSRVYAINRVKEAGKGEDKDALQKALEELQKSSMKLGEAVYKAQEAAGAASGSTATDAARAGGRSSEGSAAAARKAAMMSSTLNLKKRSKRHHIAT